MRTMTVSAKLLSLIPDTPYHYDKVIFLENDNGLYYGGAADAFREFLIEEKVRHHVIHRLKERSDKELIQIAKDCLDTLVVYETTGGRGFHRLLPIFIALTKQGYRFKFVELSRYKFQFYRFPQEAGEGLISYHNLQCGPVDSVEELEESWHLTELLKN